LSAHVSRRRSRTVIGALTAGALTLAVAPAALAAGPGYGGGTSPTGPPTGFTSVITVQTVGSRGGTVTGRTSGSGVRITVPRGAVPNSTKVAITQGRYSAVSSHLPGAYRHDRVVSAFGVELRQGASSARARKVITVGVTDSGISRNDIVVIYDSKTATFRRVALTQFKGRAVLHITTGESVAIIAPRGK
jgi:hypothetical protein